MAISIFHTVFFAIITVFGIFPNALVCFTFWRFRSLLQTSKNIIICSLAFTDFLQSILALPLGLDAAVAGHWTTGMKGCKFYAFVCSWFGLSSILHIAALSFERWHTLSTITYSASQKNKIKAFLIFAYILTFLVSCCPLLGWSEYDFEGNGLHCSVKFASTDPNNLTYTLFLLTTFFLTSLAVIVVCGIKVGFNIRRVCKNANKRWGRNSLFTKQTYRSELRMVKVISMVTVGFLGAWLPYVVVIFLKISGHTISITGIELPSLFAKTSLTYNPIIYFFFYKKFRARMFHLFLNMCNKEKRFKETSVYIPAKNIAPMPMTMLTREEHSTHVVPLQIRLIVTSV